MRGKIKKFGEPHLESALVETATTECFIASTEEFLPCYSDTESGDYKELVDGFLHGDGLPMPIVVGDEVEFERLGRSDSIITKVILPPNDPRRRKKQ
jgi:hypothetical protein